MVRQKAMFLLILPWIAFAYENVAKNKIASQKYPYETSPLRELADATKAIDGLKSNLSAFGGQCTLSANKKTEALLYVDLGAILGIHHITIFYRTGNKEWGPTHGFVSRFLGFSVFISNTTDEAAGVLCFRDTLYTIYTIPAVVTLNCPYYGRYVIYYNNRTSSTIPTDYSDLAYNEICELEVYGCQSSGHYGENCSLICPANCNNSRCHIETGHCFGCVDGYQGPMCEQLCQNKTYGTGCSKECGHCLGGKQCNHINGTCDNGCDSGYYKGGCKEECPSNLYGINCLQHCSKNCYKSETCDSKTGACQEGCVDGWKLPLCNKECNDLSYGRNCIFSCGHCQNGYPCNKKTGRCPSGCAAGYEGIYCNKTCEYTYYGPNCSLICSKSCFNQTCDAESGQCIVETEQVKDENGNIITPAAVGASLGIVFVVTMAVVVIVCRRCV